jgi:hypothetical protein
VIGSNQQFLDAISAQPAPAERVASFQLFTQSELTPFSGSSFTLWSGCSSFFHSAWFMICAAEAKGDEI